MRREVRSMRSMESISFESVAQPKAKGWFCINFDAGKTSKHKAKESDSESRSFTSILSWAKASLKSPRSDGSNSSPRDSNLGIRWFTYKELEIATDCFNESTIIRHMTFEKTYRGELASGEIVAVRRVTDVETRDFRAELKFLASLKHQNILGLVGYSDDQGEQLLVLEFTGNGCLEDHLYGSSGLPWKTRVNVALGIARGISHLHFEHEPAVVHSDLKPTNIFLADEFSVKIATSGRPLRSSEAFSVARSCEYADPECLTQVVAQHSNVYSFGIILLQLLTSRAPFSPRTGICLADKVRNTLSRHDGRFESVRHLFDPTITNRSDAELQMFLNLALQCVGKVPADRPTMDVVVETIENHSSQG